MKRKKKAVLSDEFVIAPETVRDFFERAVEERIDREQTRRPSEYVDGVAAALGQDERRHPNVAVERGYRLEMPAFLHDHGLAAVEGNLAERVLVVHGLGQADHLVQQAVARG